MGAASSCVFLSSAACTASSMRRWSRSRRCARCASDEIVSLVVAPVLSDVSDADSVVSLEPNEKRPDSSVLPASAACSSALNKITATIIVLSALCVLSKKKKKKQKFVFFFLMDSAPACALAPPPTLPADEMHRCAARTSVAAAATARSAPRRAQTFSKLFFRHC